MTIDLWSFEVLVVAAFLAHNYVVAQIYLYGTLYEVKVGSWLLVWAEFPWSLIDFVDDMASLVGFGFSGAEVVLVELIVDGGVIAVGLAFILRVVDLHPFEFL